MHSFNARRIAPAASSPEDDASQPPSSSLAAQPGKSGIKRASTACQNCKNIKRKCNQQQPCSNCLKTGTECIYDQTQDGRRRAARKRNVEELELKRDALDTILDAFRQSDDVSVQTLISMIKSDAPLDDIIQFALVNSQNVPDVQLATLAVAADTGFSRRSVLSINVLCDTPTIQVPASPWTPVTNDDHLVSHLISTYFTWYHPAYPCVVQDLFVAEMDSKDLNSSFCSPILVNAMLALACHFSDHPAVFKDPNDPSSRGQHFLDHATKLWIESGYQPRITTLQAGLHIAFVLTLMGKDRLGNLYLNQLKALVEEVTFRVQRIPNNAPEFTDMQRSLSLTMWTRYLIHVGYILAFMRAPDFSRPNVRRLSMDDSTFHGSSLWRPYPNQEPSIQTNSGRLVHLQYDLHEIGEEIAGFVFSLDRSTNNSEATIERLDRKLASLAQRVPWSDEGTILNPHLMDLNLCLQWMRMTLFNFAPYQNVSSGTYPSSGTQYSPAYAREQCIASAKVIVGLYKRYFNDYGLRNLTIWMPQTAISTAYMVIEDLDKPEVQDIFHDVCVVLTSISRRWLVMRGHTRMLFMTAEHNGKPIPDRTRQILSRVAMDTWKSDDHKHFDSSAYPNYALAKSEDPRALGMGDLLEHWATSTSQPGSTPKTPGTEDDTQRSSISTRQASENIP